MILQYPPGETSGQISLRNPELGNEYQIHRGQAIARNRSGEILSVYDADWPQPKVHVYSFTTIKTAIIESLKDFLTTTAGLKIRIIDHLDRSFDGYITTPSNEIVTTKDECSYNISFEFEEDSA